MTDAEIEGYRKRLIDLTVQCSDGKSESSPEIRTGLRQLAHKVGASTRFASGNSAHEATSPDLIANIHQALQTASMVNMCETAARGHATAMEAIKDARKFQLATIIVAVTSALAVCVSAGIALWVAFHN